MQFVTRTHQAFSVWRERFYLERRKIVPDGIEELLEPAAVAAWFMDDGTADRAGVSFQTHSFKVDEVELLAAVLNRRYALKTSLNRNKGAWVVYVHGSSVGALKALVGAHMLPELAYKTGAERDLDPVETVRRPPTNDRGEDTVRSRQQWREADRNCSARQTKMAWSVLGD